MIGQSLESSYGVHYSSVHPEMVESLTVIKLPARHTHLVMCHMHLSGSRKLNSTILLLNSGVHRFGGKTSECMNIVDSVKNLDDSSVPNPFLPQSGKEFGELLNVVLC